jgi:hypothetical protein
MSVRKRDKKEWLSLNTTIKRQRGVNVIFLLNEEIKTRKNKEKLFFNDGKEY